MKRGFLKFFLAALVVMLFWGCYKPKTYSDIPSIQFVSLTKQSSASRADSTTIITISFTDGDGDIGYTTPNGNPQDFIVSFFQKEKGVWVADTAGQNDSTVANFSGTLPYLTPDGNNKALTGEISMTQYIQLTTLYNNGINDTIHYQIFIYDRAMHQSNTITTSDIVISTH